MGAGLRPAPTRYNALFFVLVPGGWPRPCLDKGNAERPVYVGGPEETRGSAKRVGAPVRELRFGQKAQGIAQPSTLAKLKVQVGACHVPRRANGAYPLPFGHVLPLTHVNLRHVGV